MFINSVCFVTSQSRCQRSTWYYSQTFRDIFPFSFAVFAAVIIDTIIRHFFGTSFAEAVITLLQPLFTAADGYLGIAII